MRLRDWTPLFSVGTAMENTAVPSKELRFGPFELHFDGERLLRNGTGVKLQDQPLKLLLLLAEQPGRVVSRNEMRMRLWPAEASAILTMA